MSYVTLQGEQKVANGRVGKIIENYAFPVNNDMINTIYPQALAFKYLRIFLTMNKQSPLVLGLRKCTSFHGD